MSAVPEPRPQDAPPPLRWINRFATLGPAFFTALPARPLPDPYWVARSDGCAALLGWPADWWQHADALAVFSGNGTWPGMEPLATVYSGHQFGVWAGQLGDGRALWLGEVEAPDGPLELQLKGSGRTPYSRGADGRAVLRSSIREFLGSEAMHGLGLPTTRALCITGSALPVRRETVETAAVVTRVAPSFLRFGHFEHFAYFGPLEALRRLADFAIDSYYPDCAQAESPYEALLGAVARRTAELMADWQAVGFCHGVMNTDNMSLLGLTLDYGPFGFLDAFAPGHICNHSDHQGRYAYSRQPNVAFWNLHGLAHSLMPLLADAPGGGNDQGTALERAIEAIEPYRDTFFAAQTMRFAAKLGLAEAREGDMALADELLQLMARHGSDYTITFRRLADFSTAPEARNEAVRDLFLDRAAFDAWGQRYAERLRAEGSDDAARRQCMRRVNPRVVLRNHLAEGAIQRASEGDFGEVERLLAMLAHPYDDPADPGPADRADADFPPAWAQTIEVSCSS